MDDDFDSGTARGPDERPRGVPKAKLADIDLQPKLSIFYRPDRNAAMTPLAISFPKEAAKIFCDRIRSGIEDTNARSYVITGGKENAYKKIFGWITDCVQSQSIEKFPDIPEPDNDPFTPTFDIIVAGERLGIPAGSLSYHLKKRLNGCARKHLMPFTQVRKFYDFESEAYDLGLKDIACASVFNAWWDARLDETINPDLMEELSDMRDEFGELDDDLHEACKMREEEVRKKWAEKKAKKAAEKAGGDPAGDGSWNGTGNVATTDEWDAPAVATSNWDAQGQDLNQASTSSNAAWNNENTDPSGNVDSINWSKPQEVSGDQNATGTYNWADEMNDTGPEPPQTVPIMHW